MLLTENEVRTAARITMDVRQKSAERILAEDSATAERHFDIFLSHAVKDAEVVLGVYRILIRTGKSVYVDWIVDPDLDRSNVTPETASSLRVRMQQCDALFYLHTKHSEKSRWMPWELGYFDGRNGNVAILPVVAEPNKEVYSGSEYLGIYPYVDIATITGTDRREVFINRTYGDYTNFRAWKDQADKLRPSAA